MSKVPPKRFSGSRKHSFDLLKNHVKQAELNENENDEHSQITSEVEKQKEEPVKASPVASEIVPTVSKEKTEAVHSFDVLKADLSKEDEDISGQTVNTPVYAELHLVLGQIADNAQIPYYRLVNNIMYDWLMNNKETITRAKKMSKDKGALAKRFL